VGIHGSSLAYRRLARTACVGCALLSPAAHAQGGSPPIEYDAPRECPTAAAFAAQIAARTPAYRGGTDDPRLRVAIDVSASGVRGRMILGRGGQQTEREVEGERCTDVVAALAFIAAILLDPDADARPFPPPAAEDRARRVEPAATPPTRQEAEPRSRPSRWRVFMGTELGVSGAAAPSLVLGPRWFAGVTRAEGGNWLSSMRFSASRSQSETTAQPLSRPLEGQRFMATATATFTLSALRADGCALRLGRPELSVEPCLFFEGGILRASGNHPAISRSERLAWFSLGALARKSWVLWDTLVLEANAGALVPLKTYRTMVGSEDPVYENPPVGMVAGLGLAVRFR
jgi:hypothetical protein